VSRPDPYTAVHKMQRARLFELTVTAGSIDPRDDLARGELAGAIDAMVDEIVAHGRHEERFVHPLLRSRSPRLAAELEQDHLAIDERVTALTDQARQFAAIAPDDPNDLYRALARFSSAYLAHVDREESEALPSLWAHGNPRDLDQIFTGFHASRSATTNLASVFAMAPTLNPTELAAMLGGTGNLSIADVGDLLATVLTPRQLGALRRRTERIDPTHVTTTPSAVTR
jgi:hypothetical protein